MATTESWLIYYTDSTHYSTGLNLAIAGATLVSNIVCQAKSDGYDDNQ